MCCDCCEVEVCAWGWSLVQKSPAECSVFVCDREAKVMKRVWPNRGCCAIGKKMQTSTLNLECINVKILFHNCCYCGTLFFVNLLLVVPVVVGMAFLTLLEHRALGSIPFGKGPSRVAFVGILQAFRHVVGLLSSD